MQFPLWAPPPPRIDLGQDDLHLWLVELALPPDDVEQARQILSADEVERARRFHFERDGRRFIAAHAGLRSILARYLGATPPALCFQSTSHGKPFVAPSDGYSIHDLTFNLSHSGELALIGVAKGRRVGVDIEHIRPELADGKIAERFFSPAEVRNLQTLPREEQTRAFFRCWTRKEAFVKARGEGLSLPLNRFDVALLPGQPAALLNTADDANEARRWTLLAVVVDHLPAYEAAVALEGTPGRISHWRFIRDS